ncbi:Histone methylation protein DOT1 [Seminavis robusta]|uniref:Histone-lysine N-methyltransferase, H3 lysine-79 specific n=1 Tax=Seminavis robusta TaxID=568900 RepID=A0A9N8HCV1_9STRA|nr:Histone methylation protein DOT1 [Seminavis robusta]|eukprot:Sro234_g094470.1 Histone methylation protein DOT1 (318) ;mRNA; r:50401-51354
MLLQTFSSTSSSTSISPGALVHLGLQAAAALFQVPSDTFVQQLPMIAPLPQSPAEVALRKSVDELLDESMEPWASRPGYPIFDDDDEDCNIVNTKMQRFSIKTSDGNVGDAQQQRTPATYGEITSVGARQLFYHMGLTTTTTGNEHSKEEDEEIVFVDLGSGRGKLILQAFMELPILSKAVGIELAPQRHATAVSAWTDLQSTAKELRSGRSQETTTEATVEFLNEDLLEVDLSKVTHIYMASLCFPDALMHHIAAKLEENAPNLKCLATLRKFETSPKLASKTIGFQHRTEYIDMTWTQESSRGCPTFVYTKAPLA